MPRKTGDTGFAFNVDSQDARDWAEEHAGDLISGISKTTRENIKDVVDEALSGEYDVNELADEISSLLGDDSRAETIARTETIAAANHGQQEAWDQAVDDGLLSGKEKQEWIATPDDKLCPICEGLDGQQVELGEPFVDDDGEEYDGPPAHPNCRCTVGIAGEQ